MRSNGGGYSGDSDGEGAQGSIHPLASEGWVDYEDTRGSCVRPFEAIDGETLRDEVLLEGPPGW